MELFATPGSLGLPLKIFRDPEGKDRLPSIIFELLNFGGVASFLMAL